MSVNENYDIPFYKNTWHSREKKKAREHWYADLKCESLKICLSR